jgi:hypothetical protein
VLEKVRPPFIIESISVSAQVAPASTQPLFSVSVSSSS